MTESINEKTPNNIPYPELESWTFKRTSIPPEPWSKKLQRYEKTHPAEQIASAILSRCFKITGLHHSNLRWPIFRLVMKLIKKFYRIRNNMRVVGLENVPKEGAIFVVNHVCGQDVIMTFQAIMDQPIGVFTDVGRGWFADLLDEYFGFVARKGTAPIMVEKMIRSILCENRYFAMWPEGTLERTGKIMQGFSSIVKVYATVNAKSDRVPFVPVYQSEASDREAFGFKILKPVFIPRDWLKKPEDGGKTPREIIDYIMMFHARLLGQTELAKNNLLEHRRQNRAKVSWDRQ